MDWSSLFFFYLTQAVMAFHTDVSKGINLMRLTCFPILCRPYKKTGNGKDDESNVKDDNEEESSGGFILFDYSISYTHYLDFK